MTPKPRASDQPVSGKTHQGKPAGRRTVARLHAVQALYEISFADAPAEAVIEDFRVSRLGQAQDGDQLREADADWFTEVVRGATKHQADIDAHLHAVMPRAEAFARLEAILRCAFRAAAFELMSRIDVPAHTIIDEYLGVVRAFFSAAEIKLANGVLDALARRLRPNEF